MGSTMGCVGREPNRFATLTACASAIVAFALPALALADVGVIRQASAPGPEANARVGVQATVDAFRTDLGSPNNGAVVDDQGAGRREIDWDGVPDADSAPGAFPADFFNAVSARGVLFSGAPQIRFQVSAKAVNPFLIPNEFGQLNAFYPNAFSTFSAERLFTPRGSNVFNVTFVVAGTDTPAEVDGFGAVFTDVDLDGLTTIEFFDRLGNPPIAIDPISLKQSPLARRTVLATPGNEALSFLGVTFKEPPAELAAALTGPIARVRITTGNGVIPTSGAVPDDITQAPGSPDLVVLDDFIYGEPHAQPVPELSFSAPTYQVTEDAGQATITVQRGGDTAATVEVGASVSDGSATVGSDYHGAGAVLEFAPGETVKTFTLPVLADKLVEPTETVHLSLGPAVSNGMRNPGFGANPTATLEIGNAADGTAPGLDLVLSNASFRRGGGTTLNVVLSEDAGVAFEFTKLLPGRQVRGKCVKPSSRNKARKRCTRRRIVKSAGFSVEAAQGVNRIAFDGRAGTRALSRGRYEVSAVASDAAGNQSAADTAKFKVRSPKKR